MRDVIIGNARDVLRQMDSDSVDCVVTSPPYWAVRDYFGDPVEWDTAESGRCVADGHDWEDVVTPARGGVGRNANVGANKDGASNNRGHPTVTWRCRRCGAIKCQLGQEPRVDDYITHLADILNACRGPLKDTGSMWVNIGDTYSVSRDCGVEPKCRCMVPERLALALCSMGWILRDDIIWEKPNAMPSSVSDRFCTSYEHCYRFVKEPKGYFFDQPIDRGHRMRDVWRIPTEPSRYEHSAMYPKGLLDRMIWSSCPPRGTVLDPFCGSGTTLEWCYANNFECVGIEINPRYRPIIEERMRKGQSKLFDYTEE